MNITITPGLLRGAITPPPSKSESHRLIIGAALCAGVTDLFNMTYSEDIEASIACMQALGARFVRLDDRLRVTGLFQGGKPPVFEDLPRLDCAESGSTLRFLIPIALALAGGGVFTGRGRLLERPQKPYADLFAEKGISYAQSGAAITVRGKLTAGEYCLPGDVSSQFFTGLLYALPLLDGPSHLVATTPLESRSYLDMTRGAQRLFGITCAAKDDAFLISGGAHYQSAADCRIRADWSNAAFWFAARALGSALEICDLDAHSAQGDRVIAAFAQQLAQPGLKTLDVSDCPDLVPPLAVIAALRAGETTALVGAQRLRIKESDRLRTVSAVLSALGAQIEERADSLVLKGVSRLRGGTVSGHNDHRIAMLAAVAATRADGPVTITGAQCVNKSYPNFWQDYLHLGGELT